MEFIAPLSIDGAPSESSVSFSAEAQGSPHHSVMSLSRNVLREASYTTHIVQEILVSRGQHIPECNSL